MFDHQGLSKHSVAFLSMLPRCGKWFGYWENYNNNINLQIVPCRHIILHWKPQSLQDPVPTLLDAVPTLTPQDAVFTGVQFLQDAVPTGCSSYAGDPTGCSSYTGNPT